MSFRKALYNFIYEFYKGKFNEQHYRIKHKDGNIWNNSLENLVKVKRTRYYGEIQTALISEKDYLQRYYDVTRDGRVIRKKDGYVFHPNPNHKGYLGLRLYAPMLSKNKDKRKPYRIHRLVAMFYLKDYSPNLQVNHKNGNKLDNRVENLEMVTNQENVLHAYHVLDSTKRRMLITLKEGFRVIEITTHTRYLSINQAVKQTGLNLYQVRSSLYKGTTCKNGMKFQFEDK